MISIVMEYISGMLVGVAIIATLYINLDVVLSTL